MSRLATVAETLDKIAMLRAADRAGRLFTLDSSVELAKQAGALMVKLGLGVPTGVGNVARRAVGKTALSTGKATMHGFNQTLPSISKPIHVGAPQAFAAGSKTVPAAAEAAKTISHGPPGQMTGRASQLAPATVPAGRVAPRTVGSSKPATAGDRKSVV